MTSCHILVRQSRNFSHSLVLSAVGGERQNAPFSLISSMRRLPWRQDAGKINVCLHLRASDELILILLPRFAVVSLLSCSSTNSCSGKIFQVQYLLWTFTDPHNALHPLSLLPGPRTLILLLYCRCKVSLSHSSAHFILPAGLKGILLEWY